MGVAARLRDVVRRPAVAGGQRAERPALEEAGDHGGGAPCQAAWWRGANHDEPPSRHWLTETQLSSSTSNTSAQRPALAASARRWLRATTSSFSRARVEDAGPGHRDQSVVRVDDAGVDAEGAQPGRLAAPHDLLGVGGHQRQDVVAWGAAECRHDLRHEGGG